MKRLRLIALALVLLTLPIACAAKPRQPMADSAINPAPVTDADIPQPSAYPTPPQFISVYMDQFYLPYGFMNKSDPFWKQLDEDAVDVDTYDLLYKNGLRVGHANVSTWPRCLEYIDRRTTRVQRGRFMSISGVDGLPIDMTAQMPEETLFYFDQNGLTGRSFDLCTNRLAFAFQWELHAQDVIHITVCPLVNVQRRRMQYFLADDAPEDAFQKDEYLYGLRFHADLAPGEFLVIGTSPRADDPTRVGNRFLIHDGPTDRYESLLIFARDQLPLTHARTIAPTSRPGIIH
jgi:hypothetical protein